MKDCIRGMQVLIIFSSSSLESAGAGARYRHLHKLGVGAGCRHLVKSARAVVGFWQLLLIRFFWKNRYVSEGHIRLFSQKNSYPFPRGISKKRGKCHILSQNVTFVTSLWRFFCSNVIFWNYNISVNLSFQSKMWRFLAFLENLDS